MERVDGVRALLVGSVCSVVFAHTPTIRAFVSPAVQGGMRSEMVFVAGGKIPPGQLGAGGHDVAPFRLDRTEVTADAYAACVRAGGCKDVDTSKCSVKAAATYGKADLGKHPMNCVTYDEAEAYCRFVHKHMPNSAQFYLALPGAEGRQYPWGNAAPTPSLVNACDKNCVREATAAMGTTYMPTWTDPNADDGYGFTAPVGSFPAGATPDGVLDLAGNLEEWVDASAVQSGAASWSGSKREYRGGSWASNYISTFSCTESVPTSSDLRAGWVGFRCALEL